MRAAGDTSVGDAATGGVVGVFGQALEHLAAGDTAEDLTAEFPELEKDDILACIAYGAAAVRLREPEMAAA